MDAPIAWRIDCDDCVMHGTDACADCVVTFLCTRGEGGSAVVDVAEAHALRLLHTGGLAPALRWSRYTTTGLALALDATTSHDGRVPVDTATLKRIGCEAGLDAVGVAPASVFERTRDDLFVRKAEGLHGGMQFTYRNPVRSTDPSAAVRGARALVVGARRYAASPASAVDGARGSAPADGPLGAVAAYARDDHYGELRAGLDVVARHLLDAGWQARVLVDDNTLVDREAAHRAGLGWYGKNSNLLLPGRGSWFVLGSVVTDAPLEADAAPVQDTCGACRRCMTACPTDAIIGPGVVDARRCLAWLLQMRGDFPRRYRVALGDRIYGCDDCQEVCPHNGPAVDHVDDIAGDPDGDPAGSVSILAMLSADDESLLSRHGRWYIADRAPRYLRRNALVVLGNVGDPADPRVLDALVRYLDDPDPMLRSHAAWATAPARPRRPRGPPRAADPTIALELAQPVPAVR